MDKEDATTTTEERIAKKIWESFGALVVHCKQVGRGTCWCFAGFKLEWSSDRRRDVVWWKRTETGVSPDTSLMIAFWDDVHHGHKRRSDGRQNTDDLAST